MPDIKNQIKNLPTSGGVYLFKDENGNIIYVGKANSIKKRVRQHQRSKLADKIHLIEYINTGSELDSLILEAKLIKKYLPKFNIALRDDKQYPYIRISVNEEFPGIGIARHAAKDGAKYFGPFRGATAKGIINFLSRSFGIRRCSNNFLKKRKRPCLDYFTKRCAAPCADKISKDEYLKTVSMVLEFFEKGAQKLKERFLAEMVHSSNNEDFEKAADLRDKIRWIDQEINYYAVKKYKADISKGTLNELKNSLSLRIIPKRIEAFDISNLGPSETAASMVVFEKGLANKNHYRRFKISRRETPNDTAAIYEVIYRRYKGSLSKSLPDPDLIVVDGGKGQLSAACKALKDSGKKNMEVIGIAKRMEQIYKRDVPEPINLSRDSKALLLLQQIRDEAHRFAIKYHKLRRAKSFIGQEI